MQLLSVLDVAAFVRTVQRWKQAPAAADVVAVVAREAEALGEPELALRMGVLLSARPGLRGSSEEGWARRWTELKPHLEAHLSAAGHSLEKHLRAIDGKGDSHVARRVARMGA
jgi:hypothetical protein